MIINVAIKKIIVIYRIQRILILIIIINEIFIVLMSALADICRPTIDAIIIVLRLFAI